MKTAVGASDHNKKIALKSIVELAIQNIDSDSDKLRSDLEARIRRHWFPPTKNLAESISIKFGVNPDGTIENLDIVKSSKNDIADQSAKRAIEHSAPISGIKHSITCEVHFGFAPL
ncbi:MAG: hypothetical protein C0473_01615 [Cyanobacteria bacterium DS3.002]|nr:hypothetical protein [Cyanobacteria bacterium DS3.002]MBA4049557.1 hypothetical protein [Cyanobacteria bacterium DS2.008]